MKKKFRIPWLTMSAVLALIIQAVLNFCNIKLDAPIINELITLICGLLAVAGVVAPKTDSDSDTANNADITDNGFSDADDQNIKEKEDEIISNNGIDKKSGL